MITRGILIIALAVAGTGAATLFAQAPVREMSVTVGKSVVVDSPVQIERVSIANGEVAEAIAASPREVIVNGRAAGETSLLVWQKGGNRLMFDLLVTPNPRKLEVVQRELGKELEGEDISLSMDEGTVYLRGTVENEFAADRAVKIASSLGEPVSLLNVRVPPIKEQILLKVRFANVERSASTDLGVNIISTGALNTIGGTSTGHFSGQNWQDIGGGDIQLSDVLNVFLFRPDLNLGAFIKALHSKQLLEVLAEPNVLAIDGKPASFLAGGEFPFPTLQGGGSGLGQVTIQFREFGVRIDFLPKITPRGTIRLQVTPEVSALDYANGLIIQGFNIPGLNSRRVQTEIELEDGQSFAIAGLLDNRVIENWNKIPGLSSIPLIGKLFQSKSVEKNNSELLILVTPEIVRPIPEGHPLPDVEMPKEFLKDTAAAAPRTPGIDETGPVPVDFKRKTMSLEEWQKIQQDLDKPAAKTGGESGGFSSSFGGAMSSTPR